MSEVPKSDTGIHATADATNPFAPIDYTSRLKTPSRHTGTFHAMQPLQPGQLYGTAHWMSPPKPLSPRPLPQKIEELPPAQGFPSFSAPFPPYEDRSPAEPAPGNVPAAPSVSDIPPYLKRRPALVRTDTHAQPPYEATVEPCNATAFQAPPPAAEAGSASAAQPDVPSAGQAPSHRSRRSRVARHQLETAPVPETEAQDETVPESPFADPLPPLPEMPSGFSFPPAGEVSTEHESPLFPAGGEPGAPYAPPFHPGAPYRPDLSEGSAFFSQEPQPEPADETDAFWADGGDTLPVQEQPFEMPAPPLRDPFSPATHSHAAPRKDAYSRVSAADLSGSAPPRNPPLAPAPERPQRPPVRPARVAALIAAFVMLVFCLVQGSRILADLARNEREMEEVREDFLERTGMDLQSGAARVDLLPAGQTYAPSPTPALTQAVQTPSPTPVIPIRENAIQSLNKRDTSNVQEVSAPTDTPSPRTRLTEYPGNPLKNVMERLLPLIDENSDVVGQLTIPGVLEEVVVQRNNTYYLTHNYRGSSSDAGAVFVDESCSLRSPPENLLLRGQGTIEGKVFAPLWQYATAGRDFVASATTAHLTTLYEEADYVLFAVIRASSNPSSPDYFNYAGYTSFATDADMLSYIETARTHSLYSFNVDVTASDRLLTLATLGSGNESLVLLFRQMR